MKSASTEREMNGRFFQTLFHQNLSHGTCSSEGQPGYLGKWGEPTGPESGIIPILGFQQSQQPIAYQTNMQKRTVWFRKVFTRDLYVQIPNLTRTSMNLSGQIPKRAPSPLQIPQPTPHRAWAVFKSGPGSGLTGTCKVSRKYLKKHDSHCECSKPGREAKICSNPSDRTCNRCNQWICGRQHLLWHHPNPLACRICDGVKQGSIVHAWHVDQHTLRSKMKPCCSLFAWWTNLLTSVGLCWESTCPSTIISVCVFLKNHTEACKENILVSCIPALFPIHDHLHVVSLPKTPAFGNPFPPRFRPMSQTACD